MRGFDEALWRGDKDRQDHRELAVAVVNGLVYRPLLGLRGRVMPMWKREGKRVPDSGYQSIAFWMHLSAFKSALSTVDRIKERR